MKSMSGIHVLGFAGFSGSGKTTIIERIIPLLEKKGILTAVIKHDAHGLRFDTEGKDSQRFSAAGAVCSLVNGPEQSAIFLQRPLSLEKSLGILAILSEVELVLIEGYKNNGFPQIGIMRKETGKGFTNELNRFEALVTDDENVAATVPVFSPDDAEGVAAFIAENLKRFEICL